MSPCFNPPQVACAATEEPTQEDTEAVAELLGRRPQGAFSVVVRHGDGSPLVIRNAPLLDDGTPMPTRYWLVGEPERTWVSRIESRGGVDQVEVLLGIDAIAPVHRLYSDERDAALPDSYQGHRPTGGVGGTRKGVKCLHAHYAWYLAGGDDPVGRWVAGAIAAESAGADAIDG